jgi:phthiocerol/phenolphthiocerol synthesis type-I polyketide synthase E
VKKDDEILNNQNSDLDIAVIGMSAHFPGAKTAEEFWRNLRSGTESITFFSDNELLEAGVDPALLKNPNYVKAAPLLDNVEYFDAPFFKFSPREAEITDPQHRIFLECAWEALENAGYDPERYGGSIAVYAGASMNTYFLFNGLGASFRVPDMALLMGNDKDFLTTRVSYKLNLKGPSVAIGCACSTSLVAVHIACQSLLNQDCDMALAGGVSIQVPQKTGYLYQEGDIGSPDGHCRTFDANAQGTIFGSGVGVVLLKRLNDAIADGDSIHAVIKGSAVNNDGSGKVGYTAPGVDGQTSVFLQAMTNAGVSADTISYVEAHGTGTALGDPIEVTSLTRAFRAHTDKKGYCAIGSVKTNIGHLDVAAGISGFIKTVLALEHKMIPPTLHYQKANPEIDFENSPFYVNNKLMAWESPYPRHAGINSFGIGGTNAHIILEEAPVIKASGESRPWQLLLFSARTGTALDTATTNLVEHFKNNRDINLADAAYTLQVGRKAFNHRQMLVCRDTDDAINILGTVDKKRVLSSVNNAAQRDVVFVFSGQGSQYINMGLDLYKTEPVFKEEMDRCFGILRSHLNIDLHDIIYPSGPITEEVSEKLTQTMYTQPALFTIEYALARLWMSWGVNSAAMVGHSIGEYVAACLAGVFSLEDALMVIAARGRLMQELPGGTMLAVFLSEKEVQPFLNEKLSLAVINLPSQCVVSGEKEAIADLEKQLSSKNVICRHVRTSHAFHSRMMEPMINAFTERVKQVKRNTPRIPFASNVSGTWITPDEAINPEYWARHLRQTVRFSDCIQELLKEPNRVFLEVGPGNTFSALIRQHPVTTKERIVLASTRHPKDNTPDMAYILNTLGQLWLANIQVDWPGFYVNEKRRRLSLPTYPFERQRYWIESSRKSQGTISIENASSRERSEPTRLIGEQPDKRGAIARVDREKDIEQTLKEIWHDILGVKQLNNTDNFFDLGGTSLMAVKLFSEIEKVFDKRLPLAILMKASSIKQLAEAIQDEKTSDEWPSLMELQTGNIKTPLFFVHAAGGNLLIYRNLIHHLGPELAVYGLQSQGLDGKKPILNTIEDMAAQYVKEILAVRPEGPYMLAGYCMGGSVALEMAQLLRAQGKEVPLLAILETYNFSNMPDTLASKIYYRIQQTEFHLRNLLITDQKMTFFKEKAKVAWDRKDIVFGTLFTKLGLKPKIGNGRNVLLSSIWAACDLAALKYVPKAYPGRITEIRPMKEYACFSGPKLGWENLSPGGLETYELPVYPRGMLVEPFVGLLAARLKVCIQKALEKRESKVMA